ncbi:hypothetical protein [Streptoalloteichus tenebrarius]|uniref:hypothetical protein n=1 Tax=Streptoalloteichus tenebrarius (strain ATCC 17920 / DSM 40477 / JCM 4838 / CBS 697.72 / NBRC 16177 / NCIMB 11028 / NRRL B-12390 / A12253. 1 / ISP 5477) TaxID=1933 RepID=UPI0020A57886|nr:hypothetical protein [Streptoalloteichus tenebrarius]BFE99838.1 hypothetical protein GCM10020241_15140 [Streptoalloteichus tenebrarius]
MADLDPWVIDLLLRGIGVIKGMLFSSGALTAAVVWVRVIAEAINGPQLEGLGRLQQRACPPAHHRRESVGYAVGRSVLVAVPSWL